MKAGPAAGGRNRQAAGWSRSGCWHREASEAGGRRTAEDERELGALGLLWVQPNQARHVSAGGDSGGLGAGGAGGHPAVERAVHLHRQAWRAIRGMMRLGWVAQRGGGGDGLGAREGGGGPAEEGAAHLRRDVAEGRAGGAHQGGEASRREGSNGGRDDRASAGWQRTWRGRLDSLMSPGSSAVKVLSNGRSSRLRRPWAEAALPPFELGAAAPPSRMGAASAAAAATGALPALLLMPAAARQVPSRSAGVTQGAVLVPRLTRRAAAVARRAVPADAERARPSSEALKGMTHSAGRPGARGGSRDCRRGEAEAAAASGEPVVASGSSA